MEWPVAWLWTSTAAAAASVVVPWFLPRNRRALSLFLLAFALIVFAIYESLVRARDPHIGALIRIDLLWLLPLLAAGTMSCIGAFRNRQRA